MTPRICRRPVKSWLLIGIVLAAMVLIGVLWKSKTQPRPGSANDSARLPPISPSPYRNASRDVPFVGSDKCGGCHSQQRESYERTAHSKALGDLNIAAEPPDGEFEDRQSQRAYRIYRQGDTMRHEESIRTASGEKLILADLPIRYVIGSGRFSRGYLVERDGILYESPATWYAARPGWGISPGFQDSNPGFQRPIELRCLWCHVGRVEYADHSPQRVVFHSQSIDCERCHGAGSLHVKNQETAGGSPESSAGRDETIVNPSRLDRQRREDICAQCHFHGAVAIDLRGRSVLDFRPGQRLADFIVHFGLKTPGQSMEVVGHGEQMHLSRCYQASDSLTCTTCHPPHAMPSPQERLHFYRNKCLSCHTEQSCDVPQARRLADDSTDNCVACHMPRSPTEIPHLAFNHHRIGIHLPERPSGPPAEAGELIPLDEVPGLSQYDQDRNLGLGYFRFSDSAGPGLHGSIYRGRSLEILEQVDYAKHDDLEVRAALAELYWGLSDGRILEESRTIAAARQASPEASATACFTLASTLYKMRQPTEALSWLEKSVRTRPSADVWMMLCDCRVYAGDLNGGLQAARIASEMAPDRPRYLERLIELLDVTRHAGATNQVDGANRPIESHAAAASELDAEILALRRRVQILREYRARLDQMPANTK